MFVASTSVVCFMELCLRQGGGAQPQEASRAFNFLRRLTWIRKIAQQMDGFLKWEVPLNHPKSGNFSIETARSKIQFLENHHIYPYFGSDPSF